LLPDGADEMELETKVGLIVNASAARDVRRLTSLARTIDVHERVNVVARVLRGLAGGRVGTVLFMPEPAHIVERAVDVLSATGCPVEGLGLCLEAVTLPAGREALDAAGTASAAGAMARAGAACIVTIGGDGTNRAVARGWPSVVVVPLPGGTNNAFGMPIDPTAAALAAGLYASDPERFSDHVWQAPRLEVRIDGSLQETATALVDVVLMRSGWVGAHALWDPALLVEAVVARSDPALTGLAGVAGMLCPLRPEPPQAVHIAFDPAGPAVTAPLGPGQLVPIGIGDWRLIGTSDLVELGGRSPGTVSRSTGNDDGLTLAFDGEREIVLEPEMSVSVRLAGDGPRVIDAHGVLWAAGLSGELAGRRPD
jgi:hypothetical protein